jgi:hypothetical protein
MLRFVRACCLFLLFRAIASAQTLPPQAVDTLRGTGGLTEYLAGDLPLILGVPHGGRMEPPGMPDRISVTGSRYDTSSLELACAIREAFRRMTGKTPHLIQLLVHRKKVDANRDPLEGTQGDSLAIRVWDDFHRFVKRAKKEVVEQFGRGLYVDLHGHQHPHERLELGYLLVDPQLALPDDSLDQRGLHCKSSIRAMVEEGPYPLSALVRGQVSLGSMYDAEGYEAVPSPRFPGPHGEQYFSGEYNIERHGSRDGGSVSAIQLETPLKGVRDTEAHRRAFAEATVRVFLRYLHEHFHSGGGPQ